MPYSVSPQNWIDRATVASSTLMDLTAHEDWLEATVPRVAGEFTSAIGRPLHVVVTDEMAEVVGGLIVTRYRPVVSIEASDHLGLDLSGGAIRIDPAQPFYSPTSFLSSIATVRVSYTARFSDEVMEAARSAVCARVLRLLVKEFGDAVGVTSVSEEGHSDNYMPDEWTPLEQATIDSIRKRVGT